MKKQIAMLGVIVTCVVLNGCASNGRGGVGVHFADTNGNFGFRVHVVTTNATNTYKLIIPISLLQDSSAF
jgi:hypothetical protein